MQSLKEIGYVCVGMIITDINGMEMTITEIIIPSLGQSVTKAPLPQNTDLVLKLDCGLYLQTDVGWDKLDRRILVVDKGNDIFR